MKLKSFASICILLAMSLCAFIVSCTDDSCENITKDANNATSSVLIKEMESFNDSLLHESTSYRTRGFIQPGAWKRAQLMAADFSGAYSLGRAGLWAGGHFGPQAAVGGAAIGALIGGVCGSYVAYHSLYSTRALSRELAPTPIEVAAAYTPILKSNIDIQEFYPERIQLSIDANYKEIKDMGAKHNLIMENLLNNNLDFESINSQLTQDELKVLNSSEYLSEYNKTVDIIRSNNTETLCYGGDVTAKLMNLFYQIFVQYPNNCDDVEFVVNKYISAVENSSELTEQEKKDVLSSLSVAASSYEFWTKKLDKNE